MRKKRKGTAADSTIAEAAAEASGERVSKSDAPSSKAGAAASEPSSKTKAAASTSGRLTPLEIQQVEFRRGFKGYDEREVDEFLDRLTEDLAAALDENHRLRARLESGLSSVGTSVPTDAGAEAERIVERARAEAAGIIRDAEAEAARRGASGPASASKPQAGRTSVDRPAIAEFLTSEREFLKHLASLVQGHVDDVKSMAAKQPRTTPRSDATPKPLDHASRTRTGTGSAPGPAGSAQKQKGSRASESASETEAGKRVVQPVSAVEIVVDDAAAGDAPSEAGNKQTVPARAPSSSDSSSPPAGSSEDEDPSLRELFWGED